MRPIPALEGTDISANTDADGVRMFVEMVGVVRKDGEGFVDYQWNKPGETAASPKISYVKGFAPWGWVIGSGVYTDQIAAAVGKAALGLGGMALVVTLIMGAAGWTLGRSVSRPVVALAARMRRLAEGDKDVGHPRAAAPRRGRPDGRRPGGVPGGGHHRRAARGRSRRGASPDRGRARPQRGRERPRRPRKTGSPSRRSAKVWRPWRRAT
ncbi:MAG: cache domain-containing protein [Brevundimonas sp.]|nr:cache domain-containing protein [Brevundimonas sp.]